MLNSSIKIRKYILILFMTIAISILCPINVNAQTTKQTKHFSDLMGLTTTPSYKEAVNSIKVTLNSKVSGWNWKYYIAAPNDVYEDYEGLFDNNRKFDKELTKLSGTSSDGKDIKASKEVTVNFNQDEENLIVFVTLDGRQKKGDKYYHPCKLNLDRNGKLILERDFNGNEEGGDGDSTKCTGYIKTVKVDAGGIVLKHDVSNKGQCKAMREGCYYKDCRDSKYNQKGNTDYTNKMKAYFPYCFDEGTAPVNFSASLIKDVRQSFLEYFSAMSSISGILSQATQDEYNSFLDEIKAEQAVYVPSTNGDKVFIDGYNQTLVDSQIKCSKTSESDETKKYYTTNKVLDNSFCSVECTEKLDVTYGPPVAIKAAQCFQYKVTVKSTVKCHTVVKENNDWLTNPFKDNTSDCKLTAMCDSSHDQAGPNEDFDSCVNKCDGGKYSQNCINKCYKETYENNSSNEKNTNKMSMMSYNNKGNNMELLASKSKDDDDDDDFIPYKKYEDKPMDVCYKKDTYVQNGSYTNNNTAEWCYKALTYSKNTRPLGKYVKHVGKDDDDDDDKTHVWFRWNPSWGNGGLTSKVTREDVIKAGCYGGEDCGVNNIKQSIKRAATYYLRNDKATEYLIKSLYGFARQEWRTVAEQNKRKRRYVIDEHGILRQHSENGFNCPETCWFNSSGSSCALSSDDVEDDYYEDGGPYDKIVERTEQINKCKKTAERECSKTEVTYTIGADGTTYDSDSKKTGSYSTYFEDKNKSGNESFKYGCTGSGKEFLDVKDAKANTDDICIFAKLDDNDDVNGQNGLCYGIPTSGHEYKTTITFPRAYQDLKTHTTLTDVNDINKCKCSNLDNNGQCTTGNEDNWTCMAKDQYFCTRKNEKNVNEDWWKWYYSANKSDSSVPDPKNYNINAWIGYDHTGINQTLTSIDPYAYNYSSEGLSGGFGKFEWKIKLACFYAVYNGQGCEPGDPDCPNPTDPPSDPDCDSNAQCCGDCPTTSSDNVSVRVADPKDLFNDNTISKSSVKHKVGYNWTDDAKIKYAAPTDELTTNGYTILPSERIIEIESIANQEKTYDDDYIDFEIDLTPEDVTRIKSMANSRGTIIGQWGTLECPSGKSTYTYLGNDKNLSVYHSCLLNSEIGTIKKRLDAGQNKQRRN